VVKKSLFRQTGKNRTRDEKVRKGCVSTCTNSAKALVEPLEARVLYSAPLFNTDSTVALDSGAIALELASYGATAGESGTDEIHTAPEVANSDAAGSAGLLRTIQSLTDNEPPTLTGFPVDDPVFTETGGVVLLGPDLVVADAELDLSEDLPVEQTSYLQTAHQLSLVKFCKTTMAY